MKNRIFLIGLAIIMAVSCAKDQQEVIQMLTNDPVFHASIEGNADPETRVYADDSLRVLWNANDHVSIFNKTTYNREYAFQGKDGDNSGTFKKVPSEDFVTSNPLNYVYSVYPYNENTSISNDGEINVYLPAEQSYRENSFGLGANTMIAIAEEDELMFKNLCGYIMLKLYGDDVTVTSISLKGNNNEPLAGKATVTASIDEAPSLTFDASATKEITLTFDTPVTLGTTAETATSFWLVVPPTTFSKGITLTVKDDKNGEFKKSTTASLQISRNTLKRMSALEAIPEPSDDAIVFADSKLKERLIAKFDTNGDGELSYKEAAAVTSIEGAVTIKTVTSFDEFQYFTGVKTISNSAFEDWMYLTSIKLPSSISYIGKSAFKGCKNLTSFIIPEGITTLYDSVFSGCSSLRTIHLPNSLAIIGSNAFNGCSAISEIVLTDNIVSIGEYAFSGCSSLKGIHIPRLSSLMQYCFSDCSSLTSIDIPNSVITIGKAAFWGCSSLNDIVIPESVRTIANFAFYGCSSIKTITIPNSVTSLGSYAFSGCSSATSVSIPSSLSVLEESVFSGCSSLTSVEIPESISTIGISAFSVCSSLQSIIIPESVTNIRERAFQQCSSLSSVVLPESITQIEQWTFAYTALTTIDFLPNSIQTVGMAAFAYCASLKTAVLPDSITSLGASVFANDALLTSVRLPNAITTIPQALFAGCESLSSITIPESIASIGERAFVNCSSLTFIDLPNSTKWINKEAFLGDSNLTSIIIRAIDPPTGGQYMFDNTNSCPIYVPIQSVETYKTTQYWSNYADRIQAIGTPQAVDLGLSVKWASFNLGASKPEEYGDYYAWGEVEPKTDYSWATYKWCMGDYNTLTKYCTDSSLGYNRFSDDKTVLDQEDDAAHVNWGGTWRMPTLEEFQELLSNSTYVMTTENGVNGLRFTSKKEGYLDKSIFLPAAGDFSGFSLEDAGSRGFYWLSSLKSPTAANIVYFVSGDVSLLGGNRAIGRPIRPVCP